MPGNIIVDNNTTVAQLHAQVYDDNLSSYASVYAELIEQYPDFKDKINEALTFSSSFALQQEGFVDFINSEITALYEEISLSSFPTDDEEDGTIFREL